MPRRNWALYGSPATPISAEIHATADLVRAYGDVMVDDAVGRKYRAEAMAQEIINSQAWVKAFWANRELNEAQRLRRYVSPLERQKRRNSKEWERLKNYPELNGPSIASGTALNFLLNRLAGGLLAEQFSLGSKTAELVKLDVLRLDPKTLHTLRVRRDLPNGQNLAFDPVAGPSEKIEQWPFALSGAEFDSYRKKYEKARSDVISAARKREDSRDAARVLLKAFDELDAAFNKKNTRKVLTDQKTTPMTAFVQYLAAKRFLQARAGEVAQLQNAGSRLPEDDLRFTDNDLISLLKHMSGNGLLFAPAETGDEHAYHRVFDLMRDLYVFATADDDSGKAK
ncbi:MAG TPA: hypothetical protein VKU82_06780 [Planctomycetaceae bacterium]|nr:hypothetical protein [Planctomycetaceae bacterium]